MDKVDKAMISKVMIKDKVVKVSTKVVRDSTNKVDKDSIKVIKVKDTIKAIKGMVKVDKVLDKIKVKEIKSIDEISQHYIILHNVMLHQKSMTY